jgi:ankyrin repeat protein
MRHQFSLRQAWMAAGVLAGALTAFPLGAATVAGDAAVQNAALLTAVREGSTAGMQAALDSGASARATDAEGNPALAQAVVYGDENAVRLLLSRGADPNARSAAGATPLILAAGDLDKATALVEKGAEVNARSGMGRTALLAAAAQRDSYRIVKFLMENGADPNARDEAGEFLTGGKNATALMLAARSRDPRTVQLLLDHGADVNAAASTGATALTEAISARHVEAVRMLLERGARVNYAFGQIRQTPLIWASFQECPEIVEMLLDAGADVHAKDALGSTALVWAAMSERDDTATVAALLRAGALAEVKTAMGETPLTWAARRGRTGVVKLIEDVAKANVAREGDEHANQ